MNALVGRTTRCIILARLRFSWHGNSPHSQPVALMARHKPAFARSCIPLITASAALRLEGLRLRSHAFASTATACIRSRLLAWQQPAFARSCILLSITALHSALKGSVCAALLSLAQARQQPAFARSCIWRLQRFDAPRLCSRPPLHAADAV